MSRRFGGFPASLGWIAAVLALGVAGWMLRTPATALWSDTVWPAVRSADGPATGGPDAGSGLATPADSADGGASRPAPDSIGPPAPRKGGGGDEAATPVEDEADADEAPGARADAADSADPAVDSAAAAEEPAAGPRQRLQRLFAPGGAGEVRLDSADLVLLLGPRRDFPLPAGVSEPRAVPGDSLLEASASVDVERVMGDRLPALLRRTLGDSTRVTAMMSPEVPRPGVLRIGVRDVRAGRMSLPRAMIPWLIGELGLPTAADDPAALELRPGPGLDRAGVRDGALILGRDSAR